MNDMNSPYFQKIDDGYPKAIKLLNLCVGYDTEAKHLPEMIHRREVCSKRNKEEDKIQR